MAKWIMTYDSDTETYTFAQEGGPVKEYFIPAQFENLVVARMNSQFIMTTAELKATPVYG